MPGYFFCVKVGRLVVLESMLLVIVPGPVLLLIVTVNSLALVIPVTLNVPLNPELAVPTGFSVLTIFLTST